MKAQRKFDRKPAASSEPVKLLEVNPGTPQYPHCQIFARENHRISKAD
jgi:hypothetical protein